jgi:hypothetical protein
MTTPLANLEALAAAATPAPWKREQLGSPYIEGDDTEGDKEAVVAESSFDSNCNLIVAMRNSLDAILRALKATLAYRAHSNAIDMEGDAAETELDAALAALSSEPGAGR